MGAVESTFGALRRRHFPKLIADQEPLKGMFVRFVVEDGKLEGISCVGFGVPRRKDK